jgi:hypothetical protein
MKSGEAAAIINCRVSSLEFGGKPTVESSPVSTNAPTEKVYMDNNPDLPF